MLDMLRQNNGILDEIQKRLEEYVELKREVFPRLYFMCNSELLQLLSEVCTPCPP